MGFGMVGMVGGGGWSLIWKIYDKGKGAEERRGESSAEMDGWGMRGVAVLQRHQRGGGGPGDDR